MPIVIVGIILFICGIVLPPSAIAAGAESTKVAKKGEWGKAFGSAYIGLLGSAIIGGGIAFITGFMPLFNYIFGGIVSILIEILVIKWFYRIGFGKASLVFIIAAGILLLVALALAIIIPAGVALIGSRR
jgi:hypothetical protein